jgi:glycerol-3-phosphate acyltransferase PlsX
MGQLKTMFYKSFLSKLAALSLKKDLKALKAKMDYTEYGGAPLLGIKAPIVKAHGSSNAKAFKNAIVYAEKYASKNIIQKISDEVMDLSEEE